MTVDTVGGGGSDIDVWSDDGDIGLGDFSLAEDGVLARISIDHNTGQWKTNLSEEDRFDSLTVILLGLVRQRIMWAEDMDDEADGPLCKSNDSKVGHPDLPRFPFDKSGAAPGSPAISCASCLLKEWGSAPKGDAPWCSVLLTMPLLLAMGGADGEVSWMPATFSAQRTGIKPAKNYITPFKANNKPLFSVQTQMTLMSVKTKGRTYAVPQFTRGEPTPIDSYAWYFDQFKSMRTFLQTPPRTEDDDDAGTAAVGSSDPAAVIEGTVVAPTVVSTPAAPPAPAPAAAPVPPTPPAAAPAPAAAPPAPAPFASAPVAPVTPPAAPAAASAPRPVPRPVAPPAAAAATPTPAAPSPAVAPVAPPAPVATAPVAEVGVAPDDDELPPF